MPFENILAKSLFVGFKRMLNYWSGSSCSPHSVHLRSTVSWKNFSFTMRNAVPDSSHSSATTLLVGHTTPKPFWQCNQFVTSRQLHWEQFFVLTFWDSVHLDFPILALHGVFVEKANFPTCMAPSLPLHSSCQPSSSSCQTYRDNKEG